MKKYPKRGSFQDVKLNAEAVGFQIKESYKKARTNTVSYTHLTLPTTSRV